jgi:hypothetical protein
MQEQEDLERKLPAIDRNIRIPHIELQPRAVSMQPRRLFVQRINEVHNPTGGVYTVWNEIEAPQHETNEVIMNDDLPEVDLATIPQFRAKDPRRIAQHRNNEPPRIPPAVYHHNTVHPPSQAFPNGNCGHPARGSPVAREAPQEQNVFPTNEPNEDVNRPQEPNEQENEGHNDGMDESTDTASDSDASQGLFSDMSSYVYDSDATSANTPPYEPERSFYFRGRTIRDFDLGPVHVDPFHRRRVSVQFFDHDGTLSSALVPFSDFNYASRADIYKKKHLMHPGHGDIEAVEQDGRFVWRVLAVLDYKESTDEVLVSWAGMDEPTKEWTPRRELAPPHSDLEHIWNEINRS